MIVSFMIEIDSETGYPKWFHSPQEKLLTGHAKWTLDSIHSRYKEMQRVVEQGGQVFDSNPAIPVPSKRPEVQH